MLGGKALPAEDLARARGSGFPTTTPDRSPRPYLDPDPIPYGIEANRHVLETMVRMARGMRLIEGDPSIDDLFVSFD